MVYRGFLLHQNDYTNMYWLTDQDLTNIKNMGFTTISIQLFWTLFENQDGTYNQTMIQDLIRLANMCRNHGLVLLIENLSCFGSLHSWSGWLGYWQGELNGISNVYNGDLLQRLLNYLRYLSRMFAGYNNVLIVPESYPYHGFQPPQEMINEYHNALPSLVNVVRAENPSKPLFATAIHKGYVDDRHRTTKYNWIPDSIIRQLGKIIWTTDGFGYNDVRRCTALYDGNREALKDTWQDLINFRNRWGGEIMMDEFGSLLPCRETENGLFFTEDILQIFQEISPHWCWQPGYGYPDTGLMDLETHEPNSPLTLALLSEYAKIPFTPKISRVKAVLAGLGLLELAAIAYAASKRR